MGGGEVRERRRVNENVTPARHYVIVNLLFNRTALLRDCKRHTDPMSCPWSCLDHKIGRGQGCGNRETLERTHTGPDQTGPGQD